MFLLSATNQLCGLLAVIKHTLARLPCHSRNSDNILLCDKATCFSALVSQFQATLIVVIKSGTAKTIVLNTQYKIAIMI